MTSTENELHRTLGRIEGTLKSVVDGLDDLKRNQERIQTADDVAREKASASEAELRSEIGKLKARQNYRDGVLAAVVGVLVYSKDKVVEVFFGA